MLKALYHFGRYLIMLRQTFSSMERGKIYYINTMREIVSMGIGSLPIVLISSVFVGAVMTLNTSYQLTTGLIQPSVIGSIVSASTLMEFAPTVTSLLLSGRVGANIASELGTMRVYDQIDALEVMGINPASYLIMPKIIGAIIAVPTLVLISAFLCHLGGIMAGHFTGEVNYTEFAVGVQTWYQEFQVVFMVIKAFTFGFLISSISSYYGFYVQGGPAEVGEASTRAVVQSSVMVLLFDYLLAQLLL
jgi:phospholipid/cholesterol/gamma-HCH transport system permease protein